MNTVAKTREDAAVKGQLCYAKDVLWRFPLQITALRQP